VLPLPLRNWFGCRLPTFFNCCVCVTSHCTVFFEIDCREPRRRRGSAIDFEKHRTLVDTRFYTHNWKSLVFHVLESNFLKVRTIDPKKITHVKNVLPLPLRNWFGCCLTSQLDSHATKVSQGEGERVFYV